MKKNNFKKVLSLVFLFVFTFGILIPIKTIAAELTVNNVSELVSKYDSAASGDVIKLSDSFIPGDVILNKNNNNVTIDGNNKT